MRRGKIIDRWEFTVNRIKVTVPVRMHTPEKSYYDVGFSVDFTYGEHRFYKESSDVNELRKSVGEWLKSVVTFQYDTYFYVTFSGFVDKPKKRDECSVFDEETTRRLNEKEQGRLSTHLGWSLFHVGETADGKKMYRDCSGYYNCGRWCEGEPEIGAKEQNSWERDREVSALVPATPENEAALLQLADAFDKLQQKMREFLSPEQVERNLANIVQGLPLLGVESPEPEEDKKPRRRKANK